MLFFIWNDFKTRIIQNTNNDVTNSVYNVIVYAVIILIAQAGLLIAAVITFIDNSGASRIKIAVVVLFAGVNRRIRFV